MVSNRVQCSVSHGGSPLGKLKKQMELGQPKNKM